MSEILAADAIEHANLGDEVEVEPLHRAAVTADGNPAGVGIQHLAGALLDGMALLDTQGNAAA